MGFPNFMKQLKIDYEVQRDHYRNKLPSQLSKLAPMLATAKLASDFGEKWTFRMIAGVICAVIGILAWEVLIHFEKPIFDGHFEFDSDAFEHYSFEVEKEGWFGVDYSKIEGGSCALIIMSAEGDIETFGNGAMIQGNKPIDGYFGGKLSPGKWTLALGKLNDADEGNLKFKGRLRVWKEHTIAREAKRFQPD